MNSISCGFLILNSKNEILACHPTGASFNEGNWNVPKGMKAMDETNDFNTALRELDEETNLNGMTVHFEFDPGVMPYLRTKDIHLFVARARADDVIEQVYCKSTFKNDRGFWIQEMDAFTWTSDIEMFSKGLRTVIKKILDTMNIELGKVKE